MKANPSVLPIESHRKLQENCVCLGRCWTTVLRHSLSWFCYQRSCLSAPIAHPPTLQKYKKIPYCYNAGKSGFYDIYCRDTVYFNNVPGNVNRHRCYSSRLHIQQDRRKWPKLPRFLIDLCYTATSEATHRNKSKTSYRKPIETLPPGT